MLLPGFKSKSLTVTVCSMRQVHKNRVSTILFLIILNFDLPLGSSRSIIAEPSLDHKLAFAQLTLTTLLGRVLRYL